MNRRFHPGISTLQNARKSWLRRQRVGLVSHAAALDSHGVDSARVLLSIPGLKLVSLFGPEHGYLGAAGAGKRVKSAMHPHLGIPVHSLYGSRRKPTPAMLAGLDTVVVDLQDIGARPYTYVATLALVLEAAAENGKKVVVADRPIPLPCTVDGPMVEPAYRSFVSSIDAPMAYGMTPGETALWLKSTLSLDVDLRVAAMTGYARDSRRGPNWPPWIPPSPGIRSWESGQCYLSTVFCEAIPSIDNGRGTAMAFQVFGAPWTHGEEICGQLSSASPRGVKLYPHLYQAGSGRHAGRMINGVRIVVSKPRIFQPVTLAIHILDALQEIYGSAKLWRPKDTRPDFFDKLFGTDRVRDGIMRKQGAGCIVDTWRTDIARFKRMRKQFLLY